MNNQTIAERLTAHAHDLEEEGSSLYRIKAYRRAAETILGLDQPVADMVAHQGRKGLEALPGIGSHLAYTIDRLVRTGQLCTMTPETIAPERRVSGLTGVGPALTALLDEHLGVTTVAQLEAAGQDGRLDRLGLPAGRVRKLRQALARRQEQSEGPATTAEEPPVAELLLLDEEYRRKADEGRLPRHSPQRATTPNDPWQPLLSTRRAGWRCRTLFSTTALAHRLRRNHDWVVIEFDGERFSGQRTVVTETRGDLRGRRVVRGRESECRAHYLHAARAADCAHSGGRGHHAPAGPAHPGDDSL
jgi:hypothetical protein